VVSVAQESALLELGKVVTPMQFSRDGVKEPRAGVSVIIPTWNRADLLQSVLTNLKEQTHLPDQIIVVDNGSTDTTKRVAEQFEVELIELSSNYGFAVAVNEGLKRAGGDWVLLLNNDVLLQADWIEQIMAAAIEANASFATGKLLQKDDDRTIDGSWDLISRAAYAWRCGDGRPDSAVWSTRRQIWFAPMTAALFRRSLFQQLGPLESRFQSYYEDVDFGIRCALAGINGVYEPTAIAYHNGKSTYGKRAPQVMFLTARNQVLLLAKYYSKETLRRFAWPILVGQILGVLAAAKHGDLLPALTGKWEGLRQWQIFRNQPSSNNTSKTSPRSEGQIESAFLASELEIRNLQQEIGFDFYWRLYFSLVRTRLS
jgi:GT2 family glycosyltransferase